MNSHLTIHNRTMHIRVFRILSVFVPVIWTIQLSPFASVLRISLIIFGYYSLNNELKLCFIRKF